MSAQIIRLADYRSPKKTHKPKCRACRQPGHYYTSCPDAEAYQRLTEADAESHRRRIAAIIATLPPPLRTEFLEECGDLGRALAQVKP